ncbi:hypothetical protein PspLS_04099 [Pyricularia sp. CBS 133598]|nr:hypothetical protein PspLS_04099 [Pyricularia sp. CBS 133598]
MRFPIAMVLSLGTLAQAGPGGDWADLPKPLPGRSGGYPQQLRDGRMVFTDAYGDDKLPGHMQHVEDHQEKFDTAGKVYPHGGSASRIRREREHDRLPPPGRHPVTGESLVKDEKSAASRNDPDFRTETSYRGLAYSESGGYSKKLYVEDNPNDPNGYGYDKWKNSGDMYLNAERRSGAKIYNTEAGLTKGSSSAMKTGRFDGSTMEPNRGWHALGDQRRAHEEPSRIRRGTSRDRRGSIAYPDLKYDTPRTSLPFHEGGGRPPTRKNSFWTEGVDSDGQPLTGVPDGYVLPSRTTKDTFNPTRRETWGSQAPPDSYARRSHPPRPQNYETYDPLYQPKVRGPVRRPESSLAYDMESLRSALPEDRSSRRGRGRNLDRDRPPISSSGLFDQPSSSSSSSSRRESSRPGRSSSIRESSSTRPSTRRGRSNSFSISGGGSDVRLTSDPRGRGMYYDYDREYDGNPQAHSAPHCLRKRDGDGQTSSGCDVSPKKTSAKAATGTSAKKGSPAPAGSAQAVPPAGESAANAGGTGAGVSAAPAASADKKPVGPGTNPSPGTNPKPAAMAAPDKVPKARKVPKVGAVPEARKVASVRTTSKARKSQKFKKVPKARKVPKVRTVPKARKATSVGTARKARKAQKVKKVPKIKTTTAKSRPGRGYSINGRRR